LSRMTDPGQEFGVQKVTLYRPSSGTEGESFFTEWCCHCSKDKPHSEGKDFDACGPGEVCELIANSMAFDIDHEFYPKEWIYGADGRRRCLAFEKKGKPYRCPRTIDMFTGMPG